MEQNNDFGNDEFYPLPLFFLVLLHCFSETPSEAFIYGSIQFWSKFW